MSTVAPIIPVTRRLCGVQYLTRSRTSANGPLYLLHTSVLDDLKSIAVNLQPVELTRVYDH